MARRGKGSGRRAQQQRAKRFNVSKPSSTPPQPADSPTPSPRPVPAPPVRRPRRPSLSAQARAQRLQEAIQQGQVPGLEQWADTFAPQRKPDGRELDALEWWAREMAAQGVDVFLMPYQPTPSINPPRPRTLAAGYVKATQTLYIKFRNGQVYEYRNVPPNVWRNFRRVKSPGRFVNRVLNFYPYNEVRELYIPTGMV